MSEETRVKRLTRRQKILLDAQGIDPKYVRLVRELPNSMILKNLITGKTVVVEK